MAANWAAPRTDGWNWSASSTVRSPLAGSQNAHDLFQGKALPRGPDLWMDLEGLCDAGQGMRAWYHGAKRYPFAERVEAVPLATIAEGKAIFGRA
jgi:hypothetical protein